MPFSETFIKTLNDFKRMCIQMEKKLIKLRKLLTSSDISIESDATDTPYKTTT
jgi:hypothetical protein